MLSSNNKISLRQLQVLMVLDMLGTGVIVLPRRVAEYSAQDGWLIVIGLTLLGLVFGTLITTTAKRYPDDSFITYAGRILTKPVAYLLGLGLLVKILFCVSMELRLFSEIVQLTMLRHTPPSVVRVVILVVAAYAGVKGIETRARVAECLVLILLIPLLILLALALFDIDWSHLQPMLTAPPESIISGTLRLGSVFTGLEYCLLVFPYLNNAREGRKSVLQAITFNGALVLVITVVTIAKFGPADIIAQRWPVLKMMDMLDIPGSFIERQDALVLSTWIISVFAVVNAALFYSAVLIKDITRRGKHTAYVWGGAVVVFFLAFLPRNAEQIEQWLDAIYQTFGITFLFAFPVIWMLSAWLRKTGEMVKPALVILLAVLCVMTTGCWDRVEIENRRFVVAAGIDKDEHSRFSVALSMPETQDKDKKPDDASGKNSDVIKASSQSVTEAVRTLDADSGKMLYLGQAKTIVLGEALLSDDEAFRAALDALERDNDFDRKITVLAASSDVEEVLSASPSGGSAPGLFASDFYRNKTHAMGITFKLDFEHLCGDLRSLGHTIIPIIEVKDKQPHLSGATAIKNFRQAGKLNASETRGFLWCRATQCEGAVLTVDEHDNPVPMTVRKHSAKLHFSEHEERLRCIIEVKVWGNVGEYQFGEPILPDDNNRAALAARYSELIADEISQTADKFQKEWRMDGYNWKNALRSKDFKLYQKYATDWDRAFVEMDIEPLISVWIENAGSIR